MTSECLQLETRIQMVNARRMVIREATAADLSRVRALEVNWQNEGVTLGFQAASESDLLALVDECFFVAEYAGMIVAFVAGRIKTEDGTNGAVVPITQRYLELEDLYVLPQHRSTGIGGALVQAAVDWAKSKNVRYSLVYSSTKDTERILAFYRSCGFQSWFVRLFRELT